MVPKNEKPISGRTFLSNRGVPLLCLGTGTACVFHCMGVLEHGLRFLAKQLGVAFDHEFAARSWGPTLGEIESRIDSLRKERKTAEKDRLLHSYSEVATQFRYFKNAWCNYVWHTREEYDSTQAFTILSHVREFMEDLSSWAIEV